jgi:glyoxylase-like metal-dependent hydrolase (beta-lactamase superfamily II)
MKKSTMKHEFVIVGALETNCYLVYCEESRESVIIDPGAEPEKIFPVITELDIKPVCILNTHGHMDHVGANKDMKDKFSVPLLIHALDSPMLDASAQLELMLVFGGRASPPADRFLAEGDLVTFGRSSLRVVHTPGHSPGGISLLGRGILFSGDTLFCGGVGRTDLPGGSRKDLENSIRSKILTLPGETLVCPGHGPFTTVGQEIESNPFLT